METENKNAKQKTPPYQSVVKLDKLMELVTTRNLTEVSFSLFKGYGFNDFDASVAVSTLKFLALVDEDGKVRESMGVLRLKGDSKKKEFEKIVKTAYKKIFDVVDKPYELSSDDLSNDFLVHYKLTPRVLKSAIPAFLRLCEYAGLKEEKISQSKNSLPKQKRQSMPVKSQKNVIAPSTTPPLSGGNQEVASGLSAVSIANERMKLYIPQILKDRLLDDESLNEDWRTLVKALRLFADKYMPIAEKKENEKV